MWQRARSIDGRQRMRKAVDVHHGNVVTARELNHPAHERGNEQRHVAAGDVCLLDGRRQRLQAGPQAFEGAATFTLVAGHRHRRWQVGKQLFGRRDDDDRRDHGRQQPDHALQHRLGTKGQERLRRAHPRRLPTAEHDPAAVHGSRPGHEDTEQKAQDPKE